MFLYLSKLLPLFIYPLGIVCMLMVIALVSLWKRPRLATTALVLALIVLLGASNSWAANLLVRSLEWQNMPAAVDLASTEAIVVLGGATKPAAPPRPSVDLKEEGDRVLYAAQLYRQGKAPLVILSGGRVAWSGTGPSEAMDMKTILRQMGVPESAILEEHTSLNTHENAVNVKKILTSLGINRVLLVTSAMHMPRSLLIFQRQGIAAIPAPTDFLVTANELPELSSTPQATLLNLLPDTERLHQFTRALKEYIGLAVYRWRGWL